MKEKRLVALITGSSEGIGLSTARLLAAQGTAVVINGRNGEKMDRAAQLIHSTVGSEVMCCRGDILLASDRQQIVNEVLEKYGKIDLLINNAGGGIDTHDPGNISLPDWNAMLDFNLTACFAMCRLVIPGMRERGYGRIINVSSVAGRSKGRLSGPHYAAAKAGLFGLTRHLAWDLGDTGITVNAVAPGFVNTERALKKWNLRSPEDKADIIKQIPMRRFGEPDEIAAAIVFLASGQASYITGITMDVNGGYYMG